MVEWLTPHKSQYVGKQFTQPLQLWQWLNGGVVDLYQHILVNIYFAVGMLEFMEVVDPSQHLGKHFTQPFQLWQWLNGGVVDIHKCI